MRVLDLTIQNLTNDTQDIDCCDDNRRTSNDGGHTVESIWILERTDENAHLGNEAREAWQTKVSQTGNHVAYGEEWHYLHQTIQVADITSVGTTVNHTNQGKEEGCHQTVRQHLQDGTGTRGLCHHEQGEEQEPDIKVTSYEISMDEFGDRYEMANITINGHLGQILDGDNDGYADVAWIDYNDDGAMQRVELTDLNDEGILINMHTLRDQADVVVNKYDLADNDVIIDSDNTDGLIEPDNDDQLVEERTIVDIPDYTEDNNLVADNNSGFEDLGPDYSNDADVSGFIA